MSGIVISGGQVSIHTGIFHGDRDMGYSTLIGKRLEFELSGRLG